jgi:hypothetical protein
LAESLSHWIIELYLSTLGKWGVQKHSCVYVL